MTIVSVLAAKGGCGASLLATNLGVFVASQVKALLIDLSPGTGYDDLLLDMAPGRSWADLIPVAYELDERHLELTLANHPSGLQLLPAPEVRFNEVDRSAFQSLMQALAEHFVWILCDLPDAMGEITWMALAVTDIVLLISTADPPALRAAGRVLRSLPKDVSEKTGLVLNQITRHHPARPQHVADSLGIPLLAVLPLDPRAVGYQVNFGQPCALDSSSSLGRAINGLGRRLLSVGHERDRTMTKEHSSVREVADRRRRDMNGSR